MARPTIALLTDFGSRDHYAGTMKGVVLSVCADVTLVDSLIPEYGGNLFNIEGFRDRVHINISDVRDTYSLEPLVRGKDYLFNLAGQTSHLDSMTDPLTDLAINTEAQLHLLEAC